MTHNPLLTAVVVITVSWQPVFLRRMQVLLRQSPRRLRQPRRHRRLLRRVPAFPGRPTARDVAESLGPAVHKA